MGKFKGICNYIILFLLPITILLMVFIILKITPFGKESIWYIDLPAQLTMFYDHFYDAFKGDSSLFFTWNYGMGTSFWATFCYYLSSPLSFLALLFPRSFIPYSILIIWMIKVGLSSITMSYLLKKHITQSPFVIFILSIGYSLMSFSVTYYFLPMWIDAIYLLPLIIAGVYNIIKSEKHYLFLISLTLLFLANFYISYMVGIFVFLYFIAECYLGNFTRKEITKRFLLFFKGVFLAFLFTSFITIPTYLTIKSNTYTTQDINVFSFLLNPLDLYGHLFNGSTEIQNLSIYVGLGAVILVPLYFLNKHYPVRERVTYGLLLAFILFSMTSTFLNYIWHVFESPNGAYYRYSFIASFLMVILSAKAMNKIKFSTRQQLITIYFFNFIFLSLANKLLNPSIFSLVMVYINLFLLSLYTIIYYIFTYGITSKRFARLIKIALCLIVLLDVGFNSLKILRTYSTDPNSVDNNFYYDSTYDKAINYLKEIDKSFYRTKVDKSMETMINDSLQHKYKGMNIYTSTGNADLNIFLSKLGYPANTRSVSMGNGFVLSDTLFGFKYVVTKSNLDSRVYKMIFEDGDIKVYKAKINLPLGYLVNENFLRITDNTDWVVTQNQLITGAKNKNNEPFYERITLNSNQNVSKITSTDKTPFMEFNIEVNDIMELYLQLDGDTYQNFNDKIEIFVNSKPVNVVDTGLLNILDLGTYQNENVTVSIVLKDGTQSIALPTFYSFNFSKFEQEINKLKSNPFTITDYSDTHVSGNITVNDDNKLLFLSIPYDKNWRVKVNDVETDYKKVGNFIAIELTKGSYQIELNYFPTTLYICMGISALSFIVYLSSIIYRRRKR